MIAPSDMWHEPTPDEDQVTAYAAPVAEGAFSPEDAPTPPPLPGFLSDAAPGPDEVTGAEVEVVEVEPEAPDATPSAPSPQAVAWLAADLDAAAHPVESEDPDWEEAEVYDGDGPFAAPVDEPRTVAASTMDRFAEALRAPPRAEMPGLGLSGRRRNLVAPEVKAELQKPHRLQRRPTSVAEAPPQTVGEMRRRAPPRPPGKAQTRHYPQMRALLQDPDSVPYGIEPPIAAGKPAVPGTFFPTPRGPDERPQAVDLDNLLLTMAEGLLIGEMPDGGTEVRVTLKDEFFAGTELRIGVGAGEVTATLVPPDRPTYWSLSGNVHELENRLSERGLRVKTLQVLEPGS